MPEEVTTDQNEQQETEAQSEGNASESLVAPEEPQEADGQLPEGVSERTRQEFEKLKDANKRLKSELDARSNGQPQPPSLLETYLTNQPFPAPAMTAPQLPPMPEMPTFQHVTQATAETEAKKLYDEQGYVDAQELERRLSVIERAEERARDAEAKAQRALERIGRFEVDAEKKRLHEAFPELDPSSDQFNPDAYELVKNKMLDQLMQNGSQNALKAAEDMAKYFRKPKLSPQQAQTLQERSQAAGIAPSGTAGAAYASDFSELRMKSMTSDEAMDERIRRAGI